MADSVKIELLPEHYKDFLDCARYGEEESIDEYLLHGVDVNWADEFGITAMHRDWAAQQQQLDVAQHLLEAFESIDVMQKNSAGLCALDIAEDGGNAKLAALLLNHSSVDAEANRVTGADDEADDEQEEHGAAAAAAVSE